MKVVINNCFGGFSLSPKATEALAARKGEKIYWFKHDGFGPDAKKTLVPTPDRALFGPMAYTDPEGEHYFSDRPPDRDDPDLVAVVEELGSEADGPCAELKIVEIPDDVDWHIAEYDGLEHVAQNHSTWS